ncbi:MAG: STAS domain-containing protein [Pseudomonadota bacterium]|nr:STAS domain-containing protein [Pseudomonadota bacterium]
MSVHVDIRGPATAVAAVEGRLDLLTASDVKRQLQAAVATGLHRLVVDLHGVPFIDSSGLGALIGALKATRLAGGDLRIARPGEQVRYVLEISMLDRVLVCHKTVEEALARYE